MNILLFLNKDLEANIAFHLLQPALQGHSVGIYFSETVGHQSRKPTDLVRLEFYEKSFVFDHLASAGLHQGPRDCFEFFGDRFVACPFIKCEDVNSAAFITEVRPFDPDLFISIRFGQIFRNEVLDIPKHGVLNLHSGILPDYRGILGTLHALKDGRPKIGCTLHTIPNRGIDTGDVIEIATLDVVHNRSLFWHIVQLYPRGVQLIAKALKEMESGRRPPSRPQNPSAGSYYSIPTEEDFVALRSQGMEVLSAADYLDIIGQFIVADPSEELRALVEQSFSNHNGAATHSS
ncbi:MAG: formyl transferase [Bacteroidota bacterium]